MIGANQELLCPMPGCENELWVNHTACAPVYAVEMPWPGAGISTGTPDDAVTRSWEVTCTNGHIVFTAVDQARAINAADLSADLDETADYAEPFSLELLLQHLGRLRSGFGSWAGVIRSTIGAQA